jgi:hypothetical protein
MMIFGRGNPRIFDGDFSQNFGETCSVVRGIGRCRRNAKRSDAREHPIGDTESKCQFRLCRRATARAGSALPAHQTTGRRLRAAPF